MSLSLVQLAQTLQNERILNPTKLDQINQESTPETQDHPPTMPQVPKLQTVRRRLLPNPTMLEVRPIAPHKPLPNTERSCSDLHKLWRSSSGQLKRLQIHPTDRPTQQSRPTSQSRKTTRPKIHTAGKSWEGSSYDCVCLVGNVTNNH